MKSSTTTLSSSRSKTDPIPERTPTADGCSAPDIKVHLGCGKRIFARYVHIDLADYSHIDYRHDIRQLPMLESGSVSLIHASHCLEYFDRMEVLPVLSEWRRVLRPGGIIRLAVPDFAALAQVYVKHQNLGM